MATETKEVEINSIQDAVNEAAAQQIRQQEKETQEKAQEKTAPVEVEKPKEEGEKEKEEKEIKAPEVSEGDEGEEKDSEELAQAINLLKVLKDPAQAKQFGRYLAGQFEDKTQEMPVKDKEKEAEELANKLKKIVGGENEYLLDPILGIFNELNNRNNSVLMAEIKRIDNERQVERIHNETSIFLAKNNVSEKETEQLTALSKELQQAPGVPMTQYLNNLLKIARSGRTESVVKEAKEAKKDNQKIASNLAQKNKMDNIKEEVKIVERPKDGKFTPKMAMEMALRGEKFEDSDI